MIVVIVLYLKDFFFKKKSAQSVFSHFIGDVPFVFIQRKWDQMGAKEFAFNLQFNIFFVFQ